MLEVELAYMDSSLRIDIPDSISIDKFAPLSLNSDINFESFRDTLKNSQVFNLLDSRNLLIVVNDAHRSTPTKLILTWFKKLFPKQFNTAKFLVACGTHEKPSIDECRTIFGELYDEINDSIYAHDCYDADQLQSIGKDSFGKEVFLNKLLFSHDNVWTINSVEPHYFAGFTGGRKSIIPGLADFKTIERNHNLANSLDCSPLKLQGNPVAEHLESMLELVDHSKNCSLQIVTDVDNNIVHLAFGSIKDSFNQAITVAKDIYSHTCSEEYDLLLLEILPPLDRSIYQAQKALENCQSLVKDDGAIIICSGCADGIGSEHFYKLAENWDKETNKPNGGKLSFGSHKLKRVNDIGKRIKIYLKSSLSDDIVSKLFYNPVDDINEFITCKTNENKNIKIGAVYDAAHMVLVK